VHRNADHDFGWLPRRALADLERRAPVHDAAYVFFGFGRKAADEVELHLAPAALEHALGCFHELFFGYIFVDDVTHALRARLGAA
jgi:hypothetical protein